jgi:hypothetical protein
VVPKVGRGVRVPWVTATPFPSSRAALPRAREQLETPHLRYETCLYRTSRRAVRAAPSGGRPRPAGDRGAWARPRPRLGKTGEYDSGFRPPSPVGVRWVVDQPLNEFSSTIRRAAMHTLPAFLAFFCLENAVREIVVQRLTENQGADWWEKAAPKAVKDRVNQRRDKEAKNRWHVQEVPMRSTTQTLEAYYY